MIKKIGIVGRLSGDTFGVSAAYMDYFSAYGELVVICPSTEIDRSLDLLVLPGGSDVITSKLPSYRNSSADCFYEYFDKNLLPKYILNETPIFGICRGLQTLNVHFGGTLYQDVPYHPRSTIRSSTDAHNLIFNKELRKYFSPFIKNYMDNSKLKYGVNSLHHQAIEKLAPSFLPVAYSSNDKLIEVIMHQELPIAAIQYHCEEIDDALSEELIIKLLNGNLHNME